MGHSPRNRLGNRAVQTLSALAFWGFASSAAPVRAETPTEAPQLTEIAPTILSASYTKVDPAPLPKSAETAPPLAPPVAAPAAVPAAPVASSSVYASSSCTTCGTSIPWTGASSCSSCSSGVCLPGAGGCAPECCPETHLGRLLVGISSAICCTDPCYEPKWNLLADAAFFASGARPVTQTRLRADFGFDYDHPDKAELFWGKAGSRGPKLLNNGLNPRIDYQEGSMYTEAAIDRIGIFTSLPYRTSTRSGAYEGGSGLGDIVIGTKTLFIDSELLLVSTQLTTVVPSGNSIKGAGTGHTSLEPALLSALHLAPGCFLQTEFGYRFPLGGDQAYEGSLFHYHFSLNKLLWDCGHSVQIVGVLGLDGYEILNGKYTAGFGNTGAVVVGSASDIGSILNITPGIRINFCDKADFGIGTSFALTEDHFARQLIRLEARFRF